MSVTTLTGKEIKYAINFSKRYNTQLQFYTAQINPSTTFHRLFTYIENWSDEYIECLFKNGLQLPVAGFIAR